MHIDTCQVCHLIMYLCTLAKKKSIRKPERRERIDPLHFDISLHYPTHEMHACHVLVAQLLTSQTWGLLICESYHTLVEGGGMWLWRVYINRGCGRHVTNCTSTSTEYRVGSFISLYFTRIIHLQTRRITSKLGRARPSLRRVKK